MSQPDSESAEAALHEYVEVKIAVKDLTNPAREQALRTALGELKAVQNVRVEGTNVSVTYEPVRILKSAIEEHLRKAGFDVEETAAASTSPVVDATAAETTGAEPEAEKS